MSELDTERVTFLRCESKSQLVESRINSLCYPKPHQKLDGFAVLLNVWDTRISCKCGWITTVIDPGSNDYVDHNII